MNIGIRPSANSVKNETGCKAGDKCLFPHYKVEEQPNKKPKKGYYSHKRRESDDKNAVALVKIVSHLGCVSQDSDALVSQGGKSRRNPMQKVLEPIQRVRFTKSSPRRASIRELQQRCARSKAWNLAKKHLQAQRKRQGCILLSRAGMGTPGCVNKSAGGKRVCSCVVASGASMHMVSEKDLNSAELETMRHRGVRRR